MAEQSLQQRLRGDSDLSSYLKDPTEKDLLTMELGGYVPQLNLASAVGMRHISPTLADLADAITDPISAALFGIGGKLLKVGIKGGSAALRAGVRGSVKAATTSEKVALAMADRIARRVGKGLETQSWEMLRPVVADGIAAGKTPEAIIGELTAIKRDMPRWKASTGTQMTPTARNIEHIIGAIHGTRPGLPARLVGKKAVKGSPEDALAFIDNQITLRKDLHKGVIEAGQKGDVPAFLKALDDVYQIEPSARVGILKSGAKKQIKLAEKGLQPTPAAQFARMHPKIATFTPFKKAGLVPGGEAGAEAVARAQKWPIATQGFETVIIGLGKVGQAIKGGAAPPDGAAATDIVKVHIGDIQWGDVNTSVVMRDFTTKFDAPARERIGRMVMDPESAFEGVSKEIETIPAIEGAAARTRVQFKTVDGEKVSSFAGLKPKPEFGTNEAEVLVADQMKATLEDTGKYLVEEDIIRGMLDNYLPRVIRNYGKVEANKESLSLLERLKTAIAKDSSATPPATGKLSGFTRHGLPRTMAWEDLLELERKGVLEVEKDPAKLLSEYFRSVNKAAADKRAMTRLAGNAYPVDVADVAEGAPMTGALVYPRGTPPPKSISHLYELTSDPSLISVARGKYGQGITDKVWVLKEAHAPIRRAFGAGLYAGPAKSFSESALRAMLTLNSFAKRSSMFMSAFHFLNLTESMVMDMGAKFFNVRAFQRATKALYNGSDMMEFAVRSGMTVGPIVDAEWNTFSKAITTAADWLKSKRIPLVSGKAGLEGVARGWNWIDGQWNRFMWDYYQNSAKMMAFSEMYYDALRRFPNMKPNAIGESVAKHVNNAIGGINWERSWISKQGQQWARLLLFAPDYTATNLMLAADVFAAKFVKAPGQRIPFKVLFEDTPQAYYARQFAFRARTIPAFFMNHMNYALTAWRDGEGHWMHENDAPNQDRLEMPWLDNNGRKQYYRFGKQFREPMELVRMWDEYDGPWKFLNRKLGIMPQYFFTNLSGQDAIGRPIFTTKDGWVQKLGEELGYTQGQTRWLQEISDRGKLALEMGGMPIWMRQALQTGDVPASSMILTLLGAPISGGRRPPKAEKRRQAPSFGVR